MVIYLKEENLGKIEAVKMQFRRTTISSKICSGIYLLKEPKDVLKKVHSS